MSTICAYTNCARDRSKGKRKERRKEVVVKEKEKKIPSSRNRTSDRPKDNTCVSTVLRSTSWAIEGMYISTRKNLNSMPKDPYSRTIKWITLHCYFTHQFFNCWFWHWFGESKTTPCVRWCSHFVYDNLLLHGWWSRSWMHSYWWIKNCLHLARKCTPILVHGHYLFLRSYSFPRATISETFSLLGTDNA